MDGIHDLGGREGFGPVAADTDYRPFPEPWEGRVWGMARGLSRPAQWTIDWWRHGRELIDPADYLTRPYYDQWLQTYAALLVDSGWLTLDEVTGGPVRPPPPGAAAPMPAAAVPAAAVARSRYERPLPAAPAFDPGAAVRARRDGTPAHTRLPGYVRGRCGSVRVCRGGYVLPDASARGEQRAEALYSVMFEATELWPDARGGDRVILDLWESYLEPA